MEGHENKNYYWKMNACCILDSLNNSNFWMWWNKLTASYCSSFFKRMMMLFK